MPNPENSRVQKNIPHFRPKWPKSRPYLWPKWLKNIYIPFGDAHTYLAHIRESPPLGLRVKAKGYISLGKSRIRFSSQKMDFAFLTQQINPGSLRSGCIKGTKESNLGKDSSLPLLSKDTQNLFLYLRLQSLIFPKKWTQKFHTCGKQ